MRMLVLGARPVKEVRLNEHRDKMTGELIVSTSVWNEVKISYIEDSYISIPDLSIGARKLPFIMTKR